MHFLLENDLIPPGDKARRNPPPPWPSDEPHRARARPSIPAHASWVGPPPQPYLLRLFSLPQHCSPDREIPIKLRRSAQPCHRAPPSRHPSPSLRAWAASPDLAISRRAVLRLSCERPPPPPALLPTNTPCFAFPARVHRLPQPRSPSPRPVLVGAHGEPPLCTVIGSPDPSTCSSSRSTPLLLRFRRCPRSRRRRWWCWCVEMAAATRVSWACYKGGRASLQ
jgi:hypothetical protein